MTTSPAGPAFLKATALGTVLQVLMVVLGSGRPDNGNLFAMVGTAIAAITGAAYPALRRGLAPKDAALGGTAAGGLAAVIGILVSHALGDVPLSTVAVGGGASAVAGAVGGVLGRLLGSRARA